MARRQPARRAEEFVLFDVLYEDGTRTSNRKVPGSALDDIDGDLLAKPYLEAEDQKIGEISGRPRAAVKSVTRVRRRQSLPDVARRPALRERSQ
jgi:hypothetical protein